MYRNFTLTIFTLLSFFFSNYIYSQGGTIFAASSQMDEGCSSTSATALNQKSVTFQINAGATVDATASCGGCTNITLAATCAVDTDCMDIPPGIDVFNVIPTINAGGTPTPAGTYTVTINLTLSSGTWTISGGQAGSANGSGVYTLLYDIEVKEDIVVSILPTSVTVCDAQAETLTANVTSGTANTYSWRETSNITILGTASTLDVISSGTYDVTVTSADGCAEGNDPDDQIVSANSTPVISNTNCQNFQSGTTIITVTMGGATGLSYQWQRDGVNISNGGDFSIVNNGDASSVLTISNLMNHHQSAFTCNISNFCGNVTSTPCVALPIDLVKFNASKNDNGVMLEWVTASETNNDYFSIERSFDGRNFTEIGQIKGAGLSYSDLSYVYTDNKVLDIAQSNDVYYRLKQTDFDGLFSFSEVISLRISDSAVFDIIELFEEASQIKVYFNTPMESDITARVFNLSGQLLQTQSYSAANGFNELNIPTTDLRSGLYVVTLTNGTKHVSQKFVKFD